MRYITVKEALDYIESHTGYRPAVTAIYRWVGEGRLTAVRIGRRVLLLPAEIEALITPRRAQKEKGGQV